MGALLNPTHGSLKRGTLLRGSLFSQGLPNRTPNAGLRAVGFRVYRGFGLGVRVIFRV